LKCKELKRPGFIANFVYASCGYNSTDTYFLKFTPRTLLNNADYAFVANPNLHLKVFLKCMSSIQRAHRDVQLYSRILKI